MGTLTQNRKRGAEKHTPTTHHSNAVVFAAICAEYEIQAYGSGLPLYELVKQFGAVEPINSLDTALRSFDEIRLGTKPGDAAISYSDQFNRFSLAMNMPENGIAFAGLLHDQNGIPRVDEPLQLCWVRAIKDFELNGETIISKGQEFIKALPSSYVTKMKRAA